ncbi:MAG TPA: L,D-transpeptidase [Pseudonocardia sp.]
MAASYFAGPAFAAPPPKPSPPPKSSLPALVPGTPCTVTAKSCVDLEKQRAWLIKDGKVMRGPVKIASGGNGKATPIGHSLRVYRKEKDHKSLESRIPSGPKKGQPAPMPYSVFFQDGGIAFHAGSPNASSSGCIHLNLADAIAWFNYLQIGDQVQVVKGSVELANRKKGIVGPQGPSNNGSGEDRDDDDDNDDDGGSHHHHHHHHDDDDDDTDD